MADPISLSSGLVALVTFALQSSLALYNTVDSFRNHQRTARELREELEALNVVLQSLLETVTNDEKFDIPALRLPLERCGMACKGFEEKIARCTPRSNRSRTSFRDWMKLTYMGGDITEFRNMLAGYKSTINIALAAANLDKSAVTPDVLEVYKTMIEEATADLKDHLQRIDDRLRSASSQGATVAVEEERRQMEAEKLSAEQCLGICAQLSAHIDQIQPSISRRTGSTRVTTISPEDITTSTLQTCKHKLSDTVTLLDQHLRKLDEHLEMKSRTAPSSKKDAEELAGLREQRESIHQCIDICSKASEMAASERINVIEDVNTADDSCQMLISTVGELIWAKRVSTGDRSLQLVGQAADATVQQASRDHHSRLVPISQLTVKPRDTAKPQGTTKPQSDQILGFRDRFGPGFKLPQSSSEQEGGKASEQKGGKASEQKGGKVNGPPNP